MAKSVRTVKAPSLKTNIVNDIKEQIQADIREDMSIFRREWSDESRYVMDRIMKLEAKEFERETSRLSVSDWCMIACYAAIFVGAVAITIRAFKKTAEYGHS